MAATDPSLSAVESVASWPVFDLDALLFGSGSFLDSAVSLVFEVAAVGLGLAVLAWLVGSTLAFVRSVLSMAK